MAKALPPMTKQTRNGEQIAMDHDDGEKNRVKKNEYTPVQWNIQFQIIQ